MDDGDSEEIVGGGLFVLVTIKFTMFEEAPPRLTTWTASEPANAMSLALTETNNCVLLINVMGRDAPPTVTVALLKKFVPFTVSEKPGLPAATDDGTRDAIVTDPVILKACGLPEVPPPGCGLRTSTGTTPTALTIAAGTFAVSVIPPFVTVPATGVPLKRS